MTSTPQQPESQPDFPTRFRSFKKLTGMSTRKIAQKSMPRSMSSGIGNEEGRRAVIVLLND